METITVCIIDEDKDYASSLTETVAASYRGFRILAPDAAPHGEALQEKNESGAVSRVAETGFSLRAISECDVVLADVASVRRFLCDGRDAGVLSDFARKTVVMVDGNSSRFRLAPAGALCDAGADEHRLFFEAVEPAAEDTAPWDERTLPSVDKYGGCAIIVAAIKLKYARVANKTFIDARCDEAETELISFIGVEGGAGTSSAALGVARELAGCCDKRVICLSMETIESDRLCPTRRKDAGGVSEYIYFFLKGETEKLLRLRDALMPEDEYGVRRFCPSGGFNALRELDEAELSEFIAGLIEGTRSDYLIVDWGNGFGGAIPRYLSASRYCVLVTRGDGVKSDDRPEWRRRFAAALGVDADRLIVAVNFAADSEEGADACFDAGDPVVIRIGRDTSDFRREGRGVEIELTNEFGRGVKRIADRISGCDEGLEEDPIPYERETDADRGETTGARNEEGADGF
jgi:hypothetical protein